MKILLTGASGQVGQAIINTARSASVTLLAYTRSELDITDGNAALLVIAKQKPDVVINAAAYTAVDRAESEPSLAFAVNTEGPRQLAKACARFDIPLLHLSTDYVFNGKKLSPYLPDDKPSPLGVYGESKWQGEEAIRELWEKHFILRVSWVFGESGHNFVKSMLKLMQEREELRVVRDQQGCPTYAGDIASTILSIIKTSCWGTYHYCGSLPTTWYDFAQAIHEQASRIAPLKIKKLLPVTTAEYPTPARRPLNSVLDCTDFKNTFKISLSDWQKGLLSVTNSVLVGKLV